jgi:hypothetical protein
MIYKADETWVSTPTVGFVAVLPPPSKEPSAKPTLRHTECKEWRENASK